MYPLHVTSFIGIGCRIPEGHADHGEEYQHDREIAVGDLIGSHHRWREKLGYQDIGCHKQDDPSGLDDEELDAHADDPFCFVQVDQLQTGAQARELMPEGVRKSHEIDEQGGSCIDDGNVEQGVAACQIDDIGTDQGQCLSHGDEQIAHGGQLQSHIEIADQLEHERRADKRSRHHQHLIEIGNPFMFHVQQPVGVDRQEANQQ